MHHGGGREPTWRSRAFFAPAVLLVLSAGFYWKLTLTDQYTWLESNDIAYQVLPWLQYQVGEIQAGRIPLWDPFLWGGQPLIGQAQPGVASPLNWILFLMPTRDGWLREDVLNWYFVLVHYLAVLFAYWLCRDQGAGRAAAMGGGLIFGFGGYMTSVDWPQMLNGAIFAPLVLLFLLRSYRGGHAAWNSALAGGLLGVAVLSGHHQAPIYLAITAGCIMCYRIYSRQDNIKQRFIVPCIFGAFAFLVSGLQLLPAMEYSRHAVRWIGLEAPVSHHERVPYLIHSEYSLKPLSLFGIALPGMQVHTDAYIGMIALLLAVFAVIALWDRPGTRLWLSVGLGALIFALGGGLLPHGIAYGLVPLLDKARSPSMAVYLFQLAAAVLASCFLHELFLARDYFKRAYFLKTLLVVPSVLLSVALLRLIASPAAPQGDQRYLLTCASTLLFALVLFAWWKRSIGRSAAVAASLVLILMQLGQGSYAAMPHRREEDRSRNLKKMAQFSDLISTYQRDASLPRISVSNEVARHNIGDWYGVQTMRGYLASLTANTAAANAHPQRMDELFGVGYLIAAAPDGDYPELVREGKGANLYRRPSTMPRAWAVHRAVQAEAGKGATETPLWSNLSYSREVVVEKDLAGLDKCAGSNDFVRLLRRESNRVVLWADMECRGMVLLSDTHYPGWEARVDGVLTPIHAANGVIRGVVAERGGHLIEYRYRPRSVLAGLVMTLSGTAILLVWGTFLLLARLKRR